MANFAKKIKIYTKDNQDLFEIAEIKYDGKELVFRPLINENSGLHQTRHGNEKHLVFNRHPQTGKKVYDLLQKVRPLNELDRFDNSTVFTIEKNLILSNAISKLVTAEECFIFDLHHVKSKSVNIFYSLFQGSEANEKKFNKLFQNREIYVFKEFPIWLGIAIS